jgi:hypothetical protein
MGILYYIEQLPSVLGTYNYVFKVEFIHIFIQKYHRGSFLKVK